MTNWRLTFAGDDTCKLVTDMEYFEICNGLAAPIAGPAGPGNYSCFEAALQVARD